MEVQELGETAIIRINEVEPRGGKQSTDSTASTVSTTQLYDFLLPTLLFLIFL